MRELQYHDIELHKGTIEAGIEQLRGRKLVALLTPMAPLFVPGSRPDRFHKADASGADAVILDLEDGVRAEDKNAARDAISAKVASLKTPVIVRVNGPQTPWYAADLQLVSQLQIAAVMLAKVQAGADITRARRSIGRDIAVIPLVESALALSRLGEILAASGVALVAFGSIDFAENVGCAHDWDTLLAVRSEIVWRSRAADRNPPLDGITSSIEQPDLVEEHARNAARLGFGGKLAIHPRQLAPIRRAFRPTDQEIAWAKRMIAAGASGDAVKVDGEMVDIAIVQRARQLLARHERMRSLAAAAQ